MSKLRRSAAAALLSASLMAPLWSYAPNVQAAESDRMVSFLYFNDGHEISPVSDKLGTRGGVARIKTLVDSVQGEKIVAFGGDLGGGTLFGGVFKGFPMVEAFNQIPIDLANFGQHDFDAGAENTKKLVEASKFSWISSNLTGSDGKPFGQVPEYAVIEKQGIRIGVIGLTSAMETTTKDGSVQQRDVIESAKKAVEQIKQQKVDIIMALTQEPVADDKALMAAVPDIQVIFTEEEAEEQTFVHEVEAGNKFIFAPQGNMGSIVHLRLNKAQDGVKLSHEILKADETVAEEEALAKLAADYQTKLDTELGKKVAVLANDLPYGDNHESRFRETAIGNLIADAYRDYYHTDIAFANGGGIRASAKKGDFTLKDAKAILPFGNKIVVAEVTGDMLLAALENSVAGVDRLAGGFLQVSGLTYVYDANKPVGSRIVEASINRQPIQKDAKYKVAMSSFMYTGGDNYTMFTNAKALVGANEALTDFELLAAYASKLKTVDAKPEARITVRGYADVPASHWAQPAIKALTDKAILTSIDEGRFAPQASVTRREAGAAISKLLPEASASSVWTGSGLGTGDESAALSREELAVVIRWLYETKTGKPLQGAASTTFADDAQIAGGFKPAVAALVQAGLVEGRSTGQFAPKEKATRAEFAHLLAKIPS
ncbi:5'-nucleotidase C-terminal domain-containing protein [Paenibacillus sp. NPDC056579]|uniref:5'-nucleotidase C-terminal domain-containing protein n=1 Tax=Paenibacillus sp. NPDC056579 TaxID=3345871 RepID=UPI0036A7D02B